MKSTAPVCTREEKSLRANTRPTKKKGRDVKNQNESDKHLVRTVTAPENPEWWDFGDLYSNELEEREDSEKKFRKLTT